MKQYPKVEIFFDFGSVIGYAVDIHEKEFFRPESHKELIVVLSQFVFFDDAINVDRSDAFTAVVKNIKHINMLDPRDEPEITIDNLREMLDELNKNEMAEEYDFSHGEKGKYQVTSYNI